MSFIALALNYGFQPNFAVRWLKAAVTSYVVIVPREAIQAKSNSARPETEPETGFRASGNLRSGRRRIGIPSPRKSPKRDV
jgi:hypothetical protein